MARRYLDVVMNYDYDIPPKAQDVSHWWRPYYEYREFHVAVYALYPMSSEDNSLFIRDELTVSETAQRLLGRPRNWRCPSGRLEDIVREHVTMCNARLNELDEAEDDSEDDQGAWNRKPVFDPFTLLVLTSHPDRTHDVTIITLNDDRGLCYTGYCDVPVAYAFPVAYGLQKGMCTWSAVKYIVSEEPLDEELSVLGIEEALDHLIEEKEGCMEFITEPNTANLRITPAELDMMMKHFREAKEEEEREAERMDGDVDNDEDDNEEEDEGGSQEAEQGNYEDWVMSVRRHYTCYTFFFFYLNPYSLVRPVKREFIREWLLYTSMLNTSSDFRPWDRARNDGIAEEKPFPYANPSQSSPQRGYTWPSLLRTFPLLLSRSLAHPNKSHIMHPYYFLVWDHDKAGLLACKLKWDPKVLEGMSVGNVETAAWNGFGLGRPWDERDVEVVRMVPEMDAVDWLRQVASGTGRGGPAWESVARALTVQEFEKGE